MKNWKLVASVGICVALVTAAFLLIDPILISEWKEELMVEESVERIEIEIAKPTLLYGMVVNDFKIVEDVVKRNQRFGDLLQGYYIAPHIHRQLQLLSKETFDFRKISTNKKYTLITRPDSLKSIRALVYEPNPIDYYVFHFEDSMRVEEGHRPVVKVEKEVAGVIGSSLSETIENLGISHELTNRFVDIFAWQIDFARLQKGDRFKLFYEENQVGGTAIGISKIQGIYFEHFGNPYYAIPFDQGDGLDYFDANKNSLRKALLKYPIEFTRISSRYNLNRFHPVAKVFRAHLGTDFAAPTGTPIRTVGDGYVEEAQYKSNNGNYVKVRHNGTYTTQYLHMSKIAAGIHAGMRVRQGEVIGYVGSTGLATGPHLCYRFWKNGVQVDALRVELPPSEPIKNEFVTQFEQVKLSVMKRLDQISLPEPPVLAKN